MSLHYLLDGYNIVKQVIYLMKPKLKDSREALFRFIEVQQPQGSKKIRLLLFLMVTRMRYFIVIITISIYSFQRMKARMIELGELSVRAKTLKT